MRSATEECSLYVYTTNGNLFQAYKMQRHLGSANQYINFVKVVAPLLSILLSSSRWLLRTYCQNSLFKCAEHACIRPGASSLQTQPVKSLCFDVGITGTTKGGMYAIPKILTHKIYVSARNVTRFKDKQ